MNFKNFLEMGHMSTKECKNGICQIDLRIEDWSQDEGQSMGGLPEINIWKPIAGRIKENFWFVSNGQGSGMTFVSREMKPEELENYQVLPDGWETYAMFLGPDQEIVKHGKFEIRTETS